MTKPNANIDDWIKNSRKETEADIALSKTMRKLQAIYPDSQIDTLKIIYLK